MQNYQYKSNKKPAPGMSEEELQKRLKTSLAGIVVVLLIVTISFAFLGPKIGSLFGLISVNRNEDKNQDKIAPVSPIFSYIDSHTNKKELNIEGIAEPGTTIKLFVNGPIKHTTVADQSGEFTFAKVTLIEGKNTLFAKTTDSQGNESAKSETLNVTLDTKKPNIDLISPKVGETIRNLDKRITVQGKLNEKAAIKVNGKTAVFKADMTFEVILGVEEGSVEIKVEATDLAGNKNEEKIIVQYVKGS